VPPNGPGRYAAGGSNRCLRDRRALGLKLLVEKLAALPHPLPALTSPAMPSRVVTYVHRPKRPPPKKAQAAAITGPATIVTAKNPHRRGRLGDVPDMPPEEHKRRGDAADADRRAADADRRAAQDAADALRQADAARRGMGVLARLRAAWRGG
jgi:hypothetical protein